MCRVSVTHISQTISRVNRITEFVGKTNLNSVIVYRHIALRIYAIKYRRLLTRDWQD